MLVSLSIGDAYGSAFEFRHHDAPPLINDLSGYKTPTGIGTYTDDTQMTLGLAELMLHKAPDTWELEDVALAFLEAFVRDPRDGYARGFQALLNTCLDETQHGFELEVVATGLIHRLNPLSTRSGAAMRAAPLGMIKDRESMVSACLLQASLTHNTPQGHWSAVKAAAMVHYFYHRQGDPSKILSELEIPRWKGKRVPCDGIACVSAAATALQDADGDLAQTLKNCVNYGGDTDTVATIALAAAHYASKHQSLPQELDWNLERGPYGSRYLSEVQRELDKAYPRR